MGTIKEAPVGVSLGAIERSPERRKRDARRRRRQEERWAKKAGPVIVKKIGDASSEEAPEETPLKEGDTLLTVREVATRLNMSERFVRKLIEERRIAHLKLGHAVRLELREVEAFIERGRVAPIRTE